MEGTCKKKPLGILYVQLTPDTLDEACDFCDGKYEYESDGEVVYIETLEGRMRACMGDYILRGVTGEHWPIKPHIFEQTYDVVHPYKPKLNA